MRKQRNNILPKFCSLAAHILKIRSTKKEKIHLKLSALVRLTKSRNSADQVLQVSLI